MKPECLDIISEHSWTTYLLQRALGEFLEGNANDARVALAMARESLSTEQARQRLGRRLTNLGIQGLDVVMALEGTAAARSILEFRSLFQERAYDRACQCEYGPWPPEESP